MVNLGVVEQLLNHINRYALCKTTDKILLAVSGGLDSMVMFHLLKKAGFCLAVAHCNYQLRGEASAADEALVRGTCHTVGVPFFTKSFDTKPYAGANGISVQMAARDLRYAFFRELCQQHGYDYVATAHHFSDSIETVLQNLVRGTGIDGITGISPKNQNIIRPLLFATRQMIHRYALENVIRWREDASNSDEEYQRNYIRHQLVPSLIQLNPNFEETFRTTLERLQGAHEFNQKYIKSFHDVAVSTAVGRTTIDIAKLRQLQFPAVILWEVLKGLGFNFDQCKQVVNHHQPGKLFFTATHQLLVDRSQYIIEVKAPSENVASSRFTALAIENGARAVGKPPHMLTVKEVEAAGYELSKDPAVAQLDAGQLSFPLVWRRWRAGDYFTPLGMRQEKKLSDFLIDLKVPFNSKADITVVESAGDIVWVVGYRISERYKVTADTKRILVIEQPTSPIKKIS
jgi:tRNA(Ile)-lysidine synthase